MRNYKIQDCSKCEDGILSEPHLPFDPEFVCEACLLRTQVEGLQFMLDTSAARIADLEHQIRTFASDVVGATNLVLHNTGLELSSDTYAVT